MPQLCPGDWCGRSHSQMTRSIPMPNAQHEHSNRVHQLEMKTIRGIITQNRRGAHCEYLFPQATYELVVYHYPCNNLLPRGNKCDTLCWRICDHPGTSRIEEHTLRLALTYYLQWPTDSVCIHPHHLLWATCWATRVCDLTCEYIYQAHSEHRHELSYVGHT